MPFGMVSGVGRGMGVLDGGRDRRRGRGRFGVNLGRPTVTSGNFATQPFVNVPEAHVPEQDVPDLHVPVPAFYILLSSQMTCG